MNPAAVGVTGLGTYVPTGRLSAAELASLTGLPGWVVEQKLGLVERVVAGPDDHPTAMGVWAAQRALRDAGVAAQDVDVVISITEEYKEYPVWTAGIKLAHDVGASNAYAYDIGQKCGTTVLALKQAKDLLSADASVATVLIAGGYRNSDLIDLKDPDVRFMYNLGAGGGALVVQRGGGPRQFHELLGSSFITDGSFSLDVLVPVGGTKARLTAANVADYRLRVPDPDGMKQRLESASLENFITVVTRAVERSDAELTDIAYLAMLHVKRSAHAYLLERLGLAPERSTYLEHYGHIGQVDQVLSLELAREAGKLRAGELAVLVAAGVGYVWNAICLRVGEHSGHGAMPQGLAGP
ncbi:MAG TPA: 3-oxoacyl-ACP synthase [Trueperaceae bacterium]|nr:3-oxoacyl-ACP synthase [Trueperaceae bacterium]